MLIEMYFNVALRAVGVLTAVFFFFKTLLIRLEIHCFSQVLLLTEKFFPTKSSIACHSSPILL